MNNKDYIYHYKQGKEPDTKDLTQEGRRYLFKEVMELAFRSYPTLVEGILNSELSKSLMYTGVLGFKTTKGSQWWGGLLDSLYRTAPSKKTVGVVLKFLYEHPKLLDGRCIPNINRSKMTALLMYLRERGHTLFLEQTMVKATDIDKHHFFRYSICSMGVHKNPHETQKLGYVLNSMKENGVKLSDDNVVYKSFLTFILWKATDAEFMDCKDMFDNSKRLNKTLVKIIVEYYANFKNNLSNSYYQKMDMFIMNLSEDNKKIIYKKLAGKVPANYLPASLNKIVLCKELKNELEGAKIRSRKM